MMLFDQAKPLFRTPRHDTRGKLCVNSLLMQDTSPLDMELIAKAQGFQGLPSDELKSALQGKITSVSYRTGEEIFPESELPNHVILITEGCVRLLGSHDETPVSLELFKEGALLGVHSWAIGVPYEWIRAAAPVNALCLPVEALDRLALRNPQWKQTLRSSISPGELFPMVTALLRQRNLSVSASKPITKGLLQQATLEKPAGKTSQDGSGVPSTSGTLPSPGIENIVTTLPSSLDRKVRVPTDLLENLIAEHALGQATRNPLSVSGTIPTTDQESKKENSSREGTMPSLGKAPPPFCKASGKDDAIFACLKMLAGQLDLPFREDVVKAALKFSMEGRPQISLPRIGSVADMIGIATQPLILPQTSLRDQDAPFLLVTGDSPVVVQAISHHGLLIADPTAKKSEDRQKWTDWKDLPEQPEHGYTVLLARRSRSPKGEAFGFTTFIPYIRKHTRTFIEVIVASLFIQVFALANPMIIQVIIDKVIVQESLSTLDVLGGLLIICTLFGAALTAIRTFLFTDATNRIDLSVGLKVLEHMYRLPLSYFHQRPVGEIASRLRELDKIRNFLTGTALTALLDVAFSVIYVAIMIFYSVELTVISLLGVPLLVALTLFVSPIIRRQLKDRAEKNAATESHLVESLTGIQTIKGQNIETRSRWKWFRRYGDTVASSFRNTITSTAASTVGLLINRFNDVAVLWAGVYLVIDGKISLGQLIAFRILAGYVTGPLLRLAQSWQNFQEAALSVSRLGDVANRAREDQDSDEHIPIPLISGHVACHDVDFGYSPGKLQLEHVSLDVPAGSLIAMVGLSGSGKSTLLKLIARLYEPTKGSVEIDGFNLSKVELNSVRGQIGMVFQETLLLEGSVMENIAISDPEAPSSSVIEAAKLAEAHDFIMKLPNGYATPVGEQGRNLSGGQRQRIALARLIMQCPNLLLLDEATSALDAPTEQRVIRNLKERFQGKTIFFATHRLSTVRMADRIYYLENGLLKESGTHQQLMEKKGLYYALSLQQEAAE
jgi:ATP-binding cassette, subfamily B, bacterial HlyB/CyaB